MRIYGLSIIGVVLAYSTSAIAGPFGTEMGASPDSLGIVFNSEGNGWLTSDTAPIPNKIFNNYSFKFGADGLCEIRARGLLSLENELESGLKFQTEGIIALLERKYGETREQNVYNNHLRIEAPNLMWEIRGNDKSYWADWTSKGAEILPDKLLDISLHTSAKDAEQAYVTLNYQYTNYSTCDSKADAQGL